MNKAALISSLLSLIASTVVFASPSASPPILSSPSLPVTSPTSSASSTGSPNCCGSPLETPAGKEVSPHSRLAYSFIHVSGPYIAMTFDDGPSPLTTPKLLDILKARGIKATFFLIGQNAAAHPDIVRRIYAEGHEVANHSWSHPALSKCSSAKFQHELNATNEAIQDATGFRPTLIRPPYGATNANLDRIINDKYGMKVILWSVDPLDWKYRNSERVAHYILTHAKAGDIILSHDIHATTVNAMPTVLDGLLAKGFKFVTVSELIALQAPPTPKPSRGITPQGSPQTEASASPSAPLLPSPSAISPPNT